MRPTYLTGCVLLTLAGSAAAQDTAPALGEAITRLQDATVVARGTTIRITRLPIHTAGGTIYRDVTIELHVDQQGRVTLATDSAGRAIAAGVPVSPALPRSPGRAGFRISGAGAGGTAIGAERPGGGGRHRAAAAALAADRVSDIHAGDVYGGGWLADPSGEPWRGPDPSRAVVVAELAHRGRRSPAPCGGPGRRSSARGPTV